MSQKSLYLCGALSAAAYIMGTIVGGALRPGYSHIAHTVSELMAPGSPNKLLMHVFFTASAVFSAFFGVGVLLFVRGSGHSTTNGVMGSILIVLAGLITILTAAVFPQDAWGATPTTAGEMHKILVGILALLSMLSMVLMGIWFRQTGILPGFGTYSFVSLALALLAGGYAVTQLGTPLMGITERVAVLAGMQWTIVLSIKLYLSAT